MSVPLQDITLSMAKIYVSNQKMMYNIMVTNRLIAKSLGYSDNQLSNMLFDVDPITDLGFSSSIEKISDPKKC